MKHYVEKLIASVNFCTDTILRYARIKQRLNKHYKIPRTHNFYKNAKYIGSEGVVNNVNHGYTDLTNIY